MLYLRTTENDFRTCDEITDEVIAIFYSQKDAIEYLDWKTKKEEKF